MMLVARREKPCGKAGSTTKSVSHFFRMLSTKGITKMKDTSLLYVRVPPNLPRLFPSAFMGMVTASVLTKVRNARWCLQLDCCSQADLAAHSLTNYFHIYTTFSRILGVISMKMQAVMPGNQSPVIIVIFFSIQ